MGITNSKRKLDELQQKFAKLYVDNIIEYVQPDIPFISRAHHLIIYGFYLMRTTNRNDDYNYMDNFYDDIKIHGYTYHTDSYHGHYYSGRSLFKLLYEIIELGLTNVVTYDAYDNPTISTNVDCKQLNKVIRFHAKELITTLQDDLQKLREMQQTQLISVENIDVKIAEIETKIDDVTKQMTANTDSIKTATNQTKQSLYNANTILQQELNILKNDLQNKQIIVKHKKDNDERITCCETKIRKLQKLIDLMIYDDDLVDEKMVAESVVGNGVKIIEPKNIDNTV